MRTRLLLAAVAAAALVPAATASANTSNDDWRFWKVPKPVGVNGPDAREVIVTLADGSKRVIDCLAESDRLCLDEGEVLLRNIGRLRAMGARRVAFHLHEHDGPKSEFRDAAGYDMVYEHRVIPATDDAPTHWRITQSYAEQSFAFVHEDPSGPSLNEMRQVIERDREQLSIAAVKSKLKKAKAKAKRKARRAGRR